ncbi:enoyl-CoA hydratase/isomerase family protein [Pseudomonas matsuisoli]|uniref:Enoyl-CoA hydratase n=1 Tax=Pseudomonas matsuisoli TaxID=1515666 RepID=A0A917UTP8_9PSED|nr:enoyl-CoA hydratase/isomerase family protein [Pseudomonas matsuisoli]GGJ84538.1 enoyl-CoA hydratase [Pseudomonas matsuisoli]
MSAAYQTMRVSTCGGVARLTLDNPPVNVLSLQMMAELTAFFGAVEDDPAIRVVIIDSANPDYFIAHVDMTMAEDPSCFDRLDELTIAGLNPFQSLSERVRRLPQVTIVKLEGIARGGGAEFVAAADMCFAAIGQGALGQVEAVMGLVPGGGGTQYLRRRVGRNRALEIILGAELFDAQLAERYGWINRALPPETINDFVDTLADNIAALTDGVMHAVKRALPADDYSKGFKVENEAWSSLFVRPSTSELVSAALQKGVQTPEGEQHLEKLLRELRRAYMDGEGGGIRSFE